MYGKIFTSMYDGTLADKWEALITFQQLIVLSDSQGVIDMTSIAISRRTGIPSEIIEKGLKILQEPDPFSRTDIEDGKRIILIDDHKPWGWLIVNHYKYRNIINYEDKKKKDRERIAKKRLSQNVASCRNLSHDVANVANVAHTDTNTYTNTNTIKKTCVLKTKKTKITTKEKEKGFDDWWKVYIRKVSKNTALKYWIRDNLYLKAEELIKTLKIQNENKYSKQETKYVPHPSTYLNRENYNDTIESSGKPKFIDQNYETTNIEDLKWMQ